MPKYIASYDLENVSPNPYGAFASAAKAHGWSRWIQGSSGTTYRLPNTTLVGSFGTKDEAVQALKDAHASAEREIGRNFKRPKWIVATYSDATFNSDETE